MFTAHSLYDFIVKAKANSYVARAPKCESSRAAPTISVLKKARFLISTATLVAPISLVRKSFILKANPFGQ